MKPFQKGKSGNPAGKKKGTPSILAAVRRLTDREMAEKIGRRLLTLAASGDTTAIRLALEYLDGKPGDSLTLRLDQAPRADESAETFFERLRSDAVELTCRHFPTVDRESLGRRQIIVRHVKASPQPAVAIAEGQDSGQLLPTRPRAN